MFLDGKQKRYIKIFLKRMFKLISQIYYFLKHFQNLNTVLVSRHI